MHTSPFIVFRNIFYFNTVIKYYIFSELWKQMKPNFKELYNFLLVLMKLYVSLQIMNLVISVESVYWLGQSYRPQIECIPLEKLHKLRRHTCQYCPKEMPLIIHIDVSHYFFFNYFLFSISLLFTSKSRKQYKIGGKKISLYYLVLLIFWQKSQMRNRFELHDVTKILLIQCHKDVDLKRILNLSKAFPFFWNIHTHSSYNKQ